jgi:hypothetical protein
VSAAWPQLPVALFRSSLLLWQVGQALFSPDVVGLPLTASLHVHPLAVSGCLEGGCEVMCVEVRLAPIMNAKETLGTQSTRLARHPRATHPHAHTQVVGAFGLLATALQSMPIGRLDGGRMTTAVYGRKAATFISASLVLYQVGVCVCVLYVRG